MTYLQKLLQIFIKILSRIPLFVRGFFLMWTIRACGGVCKSMPRVARGLVLRYPPHSGMVIGFRLRIGPNCLIECPPGAHLTLGDDVGLTAGVLISAQHDINIGNDCLLAEGVSIRDAEHLTRLGEFIRTQGLTLAPILIQDDVWLGKGSIVLQGSTIRRGCVLGANSMFKNNTSTEYGIYVGTPAIKIKDRMP